MVDDNTPTTDTIAEGGGEQARPNLQEINERPGQTSALEARRAVANESDRYGTDDLVVEDGEVRVRDETLRQQAAEDSIYDEDELRVTEDGAVEAKREPAPEQVDLTLWEPGDGQGEVTWVGPDGQRIETKENAGATEEDPYFARVDVPETEGKWRLQVGGETVDRVDVGPAGAARDVSSAELNRGWNGQVINLDEDEGTTTSYSSQSAYASESDDPDTVAGAGAAEALQAGAEPEALSQRGPISEAEGERIAAQMAERQSDSSRETISDPSDLADADENQQIRDRIASDVEGVSADELDIVATSGGYEVVGPGGGTISSAGSGAGVPGRQPTDATYSGPGRSVGDRSTGAGTTAALEAARRQVRTEVAGQSDRIDERDVRTEVTDGRVRGYIPETEEARDSESGRRIIRGEGGAIGDKPPRREAYAGGVDVLLGSVDDAVGRALEANAEAQPGGAPFEAGDEMLGSVDEAVGRATRASAAGNRDAAVSNLTGGLDETYDTVVSDTRRLLADPPSAPESESTIVPGPTGGAVEVGAALGEEMRSAEVERDTTDRVTEGGVLSEADEERLRDAGNQFEADSQVAIDEYVSSTPTVVANRYIRAGLETVGVDTDVETTIQTPIGEATVDTVRDGEGPTERLSEGAGESVAQVTNVFNIAQGAETGTEVASNVPDEIQQDNTAVVGASALAVGRETGESIATNARTDPTQFAGSIAGEAIIGGAAGRGLGMAARRTADRARTAGGTEIDLGQVTNPQTMAYYRGESDAEDATFPGADDPPLYESDPPEAVRRQSERYTPTVIEDQFEQAGVTEGADLKKAIETEPDGPGASDSRIGTGTGFRTQEGDYESPGGFFGPELSPYFFEMGERSYSPVPGLPSMGGRPTGVVARTDVAAADVDTMDEFNSRLRDEWAGSTTARTKPPGTDDFNTGEAEVVVPPGADFRAVDGVASGGNRFGLGTNFYTEVEGRRVPLRLVAPEDQVDTGPSGAVPDTDVGAQPLESYYRAAGDSVDRPAPTPSSPTSPAPSRGMSGGDSRGVSGPMSDSLSDASRRSDRDSRRVTDPVSGGLGAAGLGERISSPDRDRGSTITSVGTPGGFDEDRVPTGGSDIGTREDFGGGSTFNLGNGGGSTGDDRDWGDGGLGDNRRDFDLEFGWDTDDREYDLESSVAPVTFANRIASPSDFLF
ncbi:hypothetical protein [Haloplanus sp. C73]|uniref:hypothetical protein n=1 Tax=Haloplanus sp. C73 TaxID=3421641 RepID=UPI003EBC677E